MTRAAIYARFSSDLQSDHSVDDQIALCRTYADRHGWHVAAVFADRAASGSSVHGRPDYARMLGLAFEGGFEIVLAEDMDRFSRNLGDIARLHERMGFLGLKLWTVADGEISDMHVGLKGTMSAMFLKNLAAKTRRGMAGVVRSGRHAGGRAYGYHAVPGEPGRLEIVPDEAIIVRRIFTLYLEGHSPRQIASILNQQGVPPPRGNYWAASTINGNRQRGHGIILNPLYAGEIVWNRVRMVKDPDTGRRISRVNAEADWQRAEAPHLAIIDKATFDAANNRKASRGGERPHLHRKARHLLSGLLRCGCCGAGMSVKDRTTGGIRIMCTRAKEADACSNRRPYPLGRIERAVVGGLREQLADDKAIRWYVSVYNDERQRLAAATIRSRSDCERTLSRIDSDLQRMTDLAIRGVISEADAVQRLPAMRAERERAAADLAATDEPPNIVALHSGTVADYRRKLSRLEQAIAEGDGTLEAESKSALRDMIETVTVHPPQAGTGDIEISVAGHLASLTNPAAKHQGGNGGSGRGT
ncbi:Site-specific DNA recombinase [Kaistia soli DSM 19436]|uniref:Site-specific DNA recombinase n=1 Tax=Kaistia soli DSM 19436 TaxID=1122133 RepID=A0A1M5MM53_9HYPH|nr:recombinase family protein [Kaistia soli]SHG78351.1 Site-specific DNA recombinase [Kaistia soli DSM 19436]